MSMTEISVHQLLDHCRPYAFFAGYDAASGEPIFLHHEDIGSAHMVSTPAGVTSAELDRLFAFQQIVVGGGLAVLDESQTDQNLRALFRHARRHGRAGEVLVLDALHPDTTNTWNGVLRGSTEQISQRVLNLLPPRDNNDPGADFYRQGAHYAVFVIIDALKAIGVAWNARDLAVLLTHRQALLDLEQRVAGALPNEQVTRNFSAWLHGVDEVSTRRLAAVFGGICGRLARIGSGKLGEVMNTYTPDIDLFDAIRERKIVHVAASQAALSEFLNLFAADLADALRSAAETTNPLTPFLVLTGSWGAGLNDLRKPAHGRCELHCAAPNAASAEKTYWLYRRGERIELRIPALLDDDSVTINRPMHPAVAGADYWRKESEYLELPVEL